MSREKFIVKTYLSVIIMKGKTPFAKRPIHWEASMTRSQESGGFFMESPPGPETVFNGRKYLYFGGTGYFGLHGNPEMIQAGIQAFQAEGTHPGTGKTYGNSRHQAGVETRLCQFFDTEACVYYVSGIMNGLYLAQSLAPEYEAIFVDDTAHFNIWDGIRSTGKPVFAYRHCDPEDLELRVRAELKPGQRPLVITDGVFPALGEVAPVPDLLRVAEQYDGLVAVDDAHAVGVLGEHGRGTFEHFGLSDARLHHAGTLSKAFGGHGGFFPGPAGLIERIKHSLGAYLGATSTPTPLAAASARGIELVRDHPEWRLRLRANTERLRAGLRAMGFGLADTPFPIVAWSLGTAAEMERVQAALQQNGIILPIFKNYAGAPEAGLLRASVFSTHAPGDIDRLLEELGRVV